MANLNKINVNGTEYDIEDSNAQESISSINDTISSLSATVSKKADKDEIPDVSGIETDVESLKEAMINKADKSEIPTDFYTQEELDDKLSEKADTSAIPTTLAELSDDETHRVVTDEEKSVWNNKSDFSGDYADLFNKPTLFDGDYNSLTNKPTIPTVPSVVSAFTNDSGYLTLATLPIYEGDVE